MTHLVWHQPHRDLGMGFRRKDCFSAFACVASPYSVDIQRRSDARTFYGRESGLSPYGGDPEILFVGFEIERRFVYRAAFLIAEFGDLIIEPGYGYASVLIMKLGNHLAEYINRIRHRAAVYTGMQISVRTGDLHFHVTQPAQTHRDRRVIQ